MYQGFYITALLMDDMDDMTTGAHTMRTHKAHARDTQFTARVKGARAHAQCAIRNSPPGSKAHARTHNARYTIHRQGQRHVCAHTMRDTQFTMYREAQSSVLCVMSVALCLTQYAMHNAQPLSKFTTGILRTKRQPTHGISIHRANRI